MAKDADIAVWAELRDRFERLDYKQKDPPEIRAEGKNGGPLMRTRLICRPHHRAFETLAIRAGHAIAASIDPSAYTTEPAELWYDTLLEFFGESDHVPGTVTRDGSENQVVFDFWFVRDALTASIRACDRMIDELRRTPPPPVQTPQKTDDAPQKPITNKAAVILKGWTEILDAVGRLDADAEWVKGLNKRLSGPIQTTQGGPPIANRDKLVGWWNSLEGRYSEDRSSGASDAEATTAIQHKFGRTATVAPEIGGSVKKRRTRKPLEGQT